MISLAFLSIAGFAQKAHYQKISDGIVLTFKVAQNKTRLLRLQVINDHIIRVTASPADSFSTVPSLMIANENHPAVPFNVEERGDNLILSTSDLKAIVSLSTGQIQYANANGDILLKEKADGRTFSPETIEGVHAYHIRQIFDNVTNSALYGLGENQLGLTNIKGKDIILAQHNSEAFIPFFVSSGHYGILWDNNSITHFGNPAPWMPLDSFKLFDQNGKAGSLTAIYSPNLRNDNDPITREDKTIDYPFLKDLKNLPQDFSLSSPSSVEWEGYIESPYSGLHSFLLYFGGYISIWINDILVFPSSGGVRGGRGAWRQSWNPAEALLNVPMEKGKKYSIKIKWIPDGAQSFLSLKWKRPESAAEQKTISLASEMGKDIDYYFIEGRNIDSVISGYRTLTGRAPIMPIWAYGFWQSREHYDSSREILNIVREFRQRHIPIDNIVQDWFYWKKDQWGSQQFDPARYPDPKRMIDSLHNNYHVHFMISVWPKFYTGTKPFREFWDKGWLYKKNVEDSTKDWVGYVSTFYDAFNKDARKAFWNLVDKRLFGLGVDAWWLDASEPDIYSNTSIAERKQLMDPTALGPSTEYFNAYPLENDKAFYKGQREVKPDQRVFILTRSAFAGSQRYAAATWSGDIGATWRDMKNQIATGISFSMSGIPYWTMDIGGFATENRYQHPDAANLAEWREQMTRWYQFGAFCPLFRAHGQAPYREPFVVAEEGTPAYKSILYYDKLRYRLLPYIYSLAGAVYLNNYTIMRGLAMDFEQDSMARNVTDEYMFGPDLLISPVYTYHARTREVYLPANTGWYDMYSGKYFRGGQTITAEAPFTRIPVFVKAGAIIPFGPALQYTQQKKADTITLYVYTGRDGHFNLYEDEGVNYNYEKGMYSIIPISYSEQSHSLTIGKREGQFSGMLQKRVFRIRWISPEKPEPLDFSSKADKTIHYDGREIKVKI
jgi:alpha-D-xyloside xylohydrolase